jgi:hypothetical protein
MMFFGGFRGADASSNKWIFLLVWIIGSATICFGCVHLKNLEVDKVWELLLSKYSTGVICYSEMNLLRIAFASTPISKIEELPTPLGRLEGGLIRPYGETQGGEGWPDS